MDRFAFEDLQLGQTTAEITALDAEKRRATLKTTCTVNGKVVVEGEATALPRSRG